VDDVEAALQIMTAAGFPIEYGLVDQPWGVRRFYVRSFRQAFECSRAYRRHAMKLATFNVNGVNGRLPVLLRWLDEAAPDVVCLQELKAQQEKFPESAIRDAGYGAIWHGQKSWNGVAILACFFNRCGFSKWSASGRRSPRSHNSIGITKPRLAAVNGSGEANRPRHA
jgi:endonuclease/exonuclease/phosphatase (EEP) superfamily protein YafD